MPFRRRAPRRRPARPRRRVGPFHRRPRFGFGMRVRQNQSRMIQYFKAVNTLSSDATGQIFFSVSPANVSSAGDFGIYGSLYQEFKILQLTVKFFPSQVGSESLQAPPAVPAVTGLFRRGNSVTWVETGPSQTPQAVSDVINRSSSRLIASRKFHKRWIDRPNSGYPEWGELDATGNITVPDKWNTNIQMYGEGFTPVTVPGNQFYWYAVITYKVIFRSKND